MSHILIDGMIHTCVLLLAAHLLVYPSYPVMAADTHSGCYRTTTVEISPRTCDPQNKNCKVPVTVSADHKIGMNLCFQGIDATYELHPVNATIAPIDTDDTRTCRPLKPSQSVTSINDPCFGGVAVSAKDAISASGIKQQGVYKMRSTDIKDGNICSVPPLGNEQSCPSGLHTLMGPCNAPTENCSEGVEVVSYYCPEVKSYSVYQIVYDAFIYTFEMKKTELLSTAPGITSLVLSTDASDDPYNPYIGWTLITNGTNGGALHYYARRQTVDVGDCTDYCAMEPDTITGIFHTQRQCYSTSPDLYASTPQVTWQEFNSIRDNDLVKLPHPSDDGSVLGIDGSYTTTHIVNPFTYTADIAVQSTRADPTVTTTCNSSRTAPALDAGIQKQTYPELDLMYVRRVCDQVVLSLYDCVLRYSHHDGSAMYWTVENTGNESECKIHVIDDTTVYDINLAVEPKAVRASTATTKRPPAWVIAIIIATGVVAALIICIVVIICLRARSRRAKKELRQRQAITNPLHADTLDDVEMNAYASSHTAQHDIGPAGNHPVLPANITANHPQTQTELPDDEIHRCEAMDLPARPATPRTTAVHMEPIEEELMVIVVNYQEPDPEAPEIVVHENEPFYAAVPGLEAQRLPTASCIPQPHQQLSRDAGRALQTDFGPRVYPFSPTSPFSFYTDQHSIHTRYQQSSLTDQQSLPSEQQAIPTDEQAIPAQQQSITTEQQAITTDEQAISAQQQSITTEQQAITTDEQAISAQQQSITTEQQAITTDEQAITTDEQAIPAQQQSITTEQQAITTDEQAIPVQQQSITTEQQAITTDEQAIPAQQQSITTEQQAITTDEQAIPAQQQSITTEQQAITTDEQAISAEQRSITTDQQAISADQQAIPIEQQRDQTRSTVETSLNPELTVCPIGQRFDDEDHDSPDVTQTQRELPDDEIHSSEAMHLPPRPVTPRTPAMHVDPSQEELTVIGAENSETEPEPEPPVMVEHNGEEPLHATVPVMEAQPDQPPAAAVLQRVSRRPDPLAHLSREQRRELLYLQTDFGPRVHPSPEISPRNSPRTAILRKRVKRWRYTGAAGGTAETIVEEPHTTESPPAVSVASSESDEQSVLTEEQSIARDHQSIATDQQSTHTEQQAMHAAEQQAALPVVRPAYQGELPEDSMETMYPSSRWFTEPEIGDELLPPAPADPPVRPAWLLREHVAAFLYLVVHIAFEIHSESEKDGVLREMKNNWSQLDTIVLGRIPGAVPLVPMTEDRRESVIPAEWEAELVRATVQSADFCMHHEQREESNEAAINASVQAGTERVLHYVRTYGGHLVSCILFVKLNTEGE